jgi:hypothetical protein
MYPMVTPSHAVRDYFLIEADFVSGDYTSLSVCKRRKGWYTDLEFKEALNAKRELHIL